MTAPRSSTAPSGTAPPPPRRKTASSVAPKPAAKKSPARQPVNRAAAADRRKVTELLRELQIDGEALSAQIERLRHRFL